MKMISRRTAGSRNGGRGWDDSCSSQPTERIVLVLRAAREDQASHSSVLSRNNHTACNSVMETANYPMVSSFSSVTEAVAREVHVRYVIEERRNQADEQQQQIDFNSLCRALEQNDASITHIHSVKGFKDFPDGYAEGLGQALQRNTHVTHLYLNLGNATPPCDNIIQPWESSRVSAYAGQLIHFVRISPSIRRASFSNKFHLHRDHDQPLVPLLCEAALQNEYIEELTLDMTNPPLDVLVFHLRMTTTALKKLSVTSWELAGATPTQQRRIEDAFRDNTSFGEPLHQLE